MNGYPKMKLLRSRSTKSRSMDFADLLYNSIPQTQNPTFKIKTPCPTKPTATAHDSVSDPDHDDGVLVDDGRKKGSSGRNSSGGGVLRRNSSVTSASSSLQSAMKRAFSMRRSSSVSERYCRIHDQSATACFLQSPPNDVDVDEEAMDGGAMQPAGSMDKKMKMKMKMKQHKNGKIFKACKRLLGL